MLMCRILMIILGFVLAIACFVAFVYLYQPRGAFICDFSGDDASFKTFPLKMSESILLRIMMIETTCHFCKGTLMWYIHHTLMSWRNLSNRRYSKRPLAIWLPSKVGFISQVATRLYLSHQLLFHRLAWVFRIVQQVGPKLKTLLPFLKYWPFLTPQPFRSFCFR